MAVIIQDCKINILINILLYSLLENAPNIFFFFFGLVTSFLEAIIIESIMIAITVANNSYRFRADLVVKVS